MDPTVTQAVTMYGIAIIISFLVALLIKGLYLVIRLFGRKNPTH